MQSHKVYIVAKLVCINLSSIINCYILTSIMLNTFACTFLKVQDQGADQKKFFHTGPQCRLHISVLILFTTF